MERITRTLQSRDGTPIAYERMGDGPPVILVDGALCHRASGPMRPLASLLAQQFTVWLYDRRGRGESGDTGPYAVEREIEDLGALIRESGGEASVYGVSSGAALALEAANCGLPISRLALYEAPFIVDDSRPPVPPDIVEQLEAAVAAGRRGDAVRLFMRQVGVPRIFVALMRFMPAWPKLTAVAHTIAYDMTIVAEHQRGRRLPAMRWTSVTMPTVVIDGGRSAAWMRNGMHALASVLPGAAYRTLEGQTHMVSPKALAPVLAEFFRT